MGHHDRRAAEEPVRRPDHPGHPDRNQRVDPTLVRLHDQVDRVGTVGRRAPLTQAASRDLFPQGSAHGVPVGPGAGPQAQGREDLAVGRRQDDVAGHARGHLHPLPSRRTHPSERKPGCRSRPVGHGLVSGGRIRRDRSVAGQRPAGVQTPCGSAGHLVAGADVLDLAAGQAPEPDERDAAAVGVADLPAELVGLGCHLAGDAAGAEQLGHRRRLRPGLLGVDRHQHDRRHRPRRPEQALGQQRGQQPGDADGQPHPRIGRLAVAGQGVVAAAGGDRAVALVADQLGLVDRAGVVVETAGDLQVGHDPPRHVRRGRADHVGQQLQPLVEQVVLDAERPHLGDEGGVPRGDLGQPDTAVGLGRGETGLVGEQRPHPVRPDLVDLVDLTQHRGRVGDVQAQVEALGQPPVVHPHQHRRQLEVDVQPLQGGQRDQRQLDVVVRGQGVGVDDVHVGLGELAVPPLLGPLAAPDLLDLVAPEGEVELVGVLQHVAGERHGQVEVQPQLGPGAGVGVQPLDGVHLLVDLTLLGQPVQRLDGAGLDRGEPVQLEGLPQPVEHQLLDDPLFRGELRKA